MSALAELIERLEKATGRSRVLDFEIHLAAVGDPIWPAHDLTGRVTNPNSRMSDYLAQWRDVIDADDQDFDFPRYTGSLDAALTLVPDGFSYHINFGRHIGGASCWLCPEGPDSGGVADPRSRDAHHSHTAIALCIAALRARLAQTPESSK